MLGRGKTVKRSAVLQSFIIAALTLGAPASSGVDISAQGQAPPAVPAVGRAASALPMTVSGRYVVGGYVNAMVGVGRVVYVGGEFARIANRTGSAVVVPAKGGAIEPIRAEIAGGSVNAAVADGAGGWYVGGSFTTVGDVPRVGLAHMRADGRLDPVFAPPVLGEIQALALHGSILVAAGVPQPHAKAVSRALDATTGAALPITYAPPQGAGGVRVLLANGNRLYMGFGNRRIAAYDVASGNRLWARRFCESCQEDRGGVAALAIDREKLIVGGGFTQGRNKNLAALDAASGALIGHSLHVPKRVGSIAVVRGAVYVAYDRSHPGSSGLAIVTLTNGRLRSWGAIRPSHLATDGTALYMEGPSAKDERNDSRFTGIYGARAGTAHAVLRRVSPPLAGGDVFTLVPQGGRLLVGGSFSGVGGAVRQNLAAFDTGTGHLLDWHPNASDAGCCGVTALAAAGRTIYVGGPFTRVSGAPRTGLAAVSAKTGGLLPWRPRLENWDDLSLAVGHGRVFVGASSLFLPGADRRKPSPELHLVAFSERGTGRRLRFSPRLGDEFEIGALTVWHRAVLVGGQSVIAYSVDGDGRHELWRRSTDSYVFAFARRGATLYAGGNFDHVGRRPRQNLAAFALNRRGALLPFASRVPIGVEALASLGSELVFGGQDFDSDSPQVLGAVGKDGKLEPWHVDAPPGEFAVILGMARIKDSLVVAGDFDWLGPEGNQAAGGIAWLR